MCKDKRQLMLLASVIHLDLCTRKRPPLEFLQGVAILTEICNRLFECCGCTDSGERIH